MIDLFKSIKSLIKLNKICIDNHIFRLHYKATVILLIACSILVTAKQFFGEPIACISDDIPQKVMDTYCWIQSTFTIPDRFNMKIGSEVAHPGVGTYVPDKDEVKYHKYYQWVCFMLFFQAICFYIPHYVWKVWESNRIRHLVSDLSDPMLSDGTRKKQLQILTKYLLENIGLHNWYAYRFFACEIFNFVNVILQILLVDRFLDYEFSNYGAQVLSFMEEEPEVRNDPMTRIFPKVTKCIFHKYGPTGSIQKFDSLCVLPLNIINEKIYIVLWFWFITIAIVSGMSILYRAMICVFPQTRLQVLRMRNRVVRFHSLSYVFEHGKIGDWFMFLQLARNMDPLTYKELIESIENELITKSEPKSYRISMAKERDSRDESDMFKIEKVDDLHKF